MVGRYDMGRTGKSHRGLILYIHEFIALNLPNITIQIEICFDHLWRYVFFIIIIYLILLKLLQNLHRMNWMFDSQEDKGSHYCKYGQVVVLANDCEPEFCTKTIGSRLTTRLKKKNKILIIQSLQSYALSRTCYFSFTFLNHI